MESTLLVDWTPSTAKIANFLLAKPEGRYTLTWAILITLWWPLLTAIIPRLCLIGFNFAQPFLITRTLNLLYQPINETSKDEGYGLIGAAGLIYLGIAVCNKISCLRFKVY